MKKTAPSTNGKTGSGRSLPETMTPAVAQAVLEDAVMEAAADLAALSATLGNTDSDTDRIIAGIIPETPEEEEILAALSIPYLGDTRKQALADVGIKTMADLRGATQAEIGNARGVGQAAAARVKVWLESQPAALSQTPPPSDVKPPEPVADSPDPALADAVQSIFSDLGDVDTAISRLMTTLGTKGTKALVRQLDKISTVTSELAEGPDTLSPEQLQSAVKSLGKITRLLETAADAGKLSDSKQEALIEKLRGYRKALQKAIND